ncbi:hypothetical protein FUA48_11640 [Flavobacterium alkalisoli]|uniref:Uncharacterized protein n=1 Tax=Flavobacterium alkalisoli TaxID=2602769 RepID=A0A5B9FW19_9FLAO|nr:hypothetical protein [Flavobacterium alkalisoli]QEE50206.1 hypothetical protein FUA48_11640 [Flavobacterium alkalisoli]
MKKLITLPVLFLLALSCKQKDTVTVQTEREIKLSLYHIKCTTDIKGVSFDTLNYFERDSLSLKRIQVKDTLTYIYPYRYMMDYTDTLAITKTNVVLRDELKYLSQKTFKLNGKPIVVKKYLQDVFPTGPTGNVFINDSLGIVMSRMVGHPYSVHIHCYDVENLEELHKSIAVDDVFFELIITKS